ncbi:MAG: V-type ATP synthase subunit A [Methanotrichaceae archaeon]
MSITGRIYKITGPLVVAEDVKGCVMYELVRVGDIGLMGETIRLDEDRAYIQVYEATEGLKPGEPVETTGAPLTADLGPGILKNFYDGIQRPLEDLKKVAGDYITRGLVVPPLDPETTWDYTAVAKEGSSVEGGDILGTTPETKVINHKVLVPPMVSGKLTNVRDGKLHVTDVVATLTQEDGTETELTMSHQWPVRIPRPYKEKLDPLIPLLTGQRIYDTFFPLAKGGTAAIPGGFGTGKTVSQQQLAKWANSQVVVYVGCGERGNEMTEVLDTFPLLDDPTTGEKLMERSALIANTSNMPVAAREASVYTGVTIAEYYRDMGYDVAVMADSTSRWAEAMREVSGRLEEMPGEEGYPAYLASRVADYYERGGRVITKGSGEERTGSVSLVGAVSPPGGDLSEPVSQNTLRVVSVFWALDSTLADRRHFPAINWLRSYSLYLDVLSDWYTNNIADDFLDVRTKMMVLLQKEAELQEIVQLVGADALPERERLVLEVSRMVREDFLQQNAYHEVDSYCSKEKQYMMANTILGFYDRASKAMDNGVSIANIETIDVKNEIARMKYVPNPDFPGWYDTVLKTIEAQFSALEG